MIPIKTREDIEKMARGGRILAMILDGLEKLVKCGVTTKSLDDAAVRLMDAHGVRSAFKGYRGYPGHICVSLNEEVVHGIPGTRRLAEGDIVSVDAGIEYENFFTDMARTFPVGEVEDVKTRLIEAARGSLEAGIAAVKAGEKLVCVSRAVQQYVESRGFSVVRDFVGHGIGRALHEEPQIPNYVARDEGPVLKDGMVLAIEPMINAGSHEVKILRDGWTAVTCDRQPSAHYEHTVAIVDGAARVLTKV
jgi:methionyl aminopeptidase